MNDVDFVFPWRVAITDINYGGHVGNAAVLGFFQEARIAYLARLGPYSETEVGGCGLIMVEAQVFFRREMFHPEQLLIGVRVLETKRSSFVLGYRIEANRQVTAEGTTSMVCFDYRLRKPCRLPAPFRAALERSAPA